MPKYPEKSLPDNLIGALGRTVALEQSLGLAVLAIVSVLGTWPPALNR
jgi:putative copper export protein